VTSGWVLLISEPQFGETFSVSWFSQLFKLVSKAVGTDFESGENFSVSISIYFTGVALVQACNLYFVGFVKERSPVVEARDFLCEEKGENSCFFPV
jgi:hypothetical protein